MHKIKIIITREFLTRVRKPSFWVMTVVGPLLLAALWLIPFLLSNTSDTVSAIGVLDRTAEREPLLQKGIFESHFKNSKETIFEVCENMDSAGAKLKREELDGVLEIVYTNDNPSIKGFLYFSENAPNMVVQNNIRRQMEDIFKSYVLSCDYGMTDEQIAWVNNPDIGFYTKEISSGKDSFTGIKTGLGLACGILVYVFIFMFGVQVMTGVSVEKNNRIVEVLASSVKPFQLMMGKIIGIAIVGLTQFLLWIVLSAALIFGIQIGNPDMFSPPKTEQIVLNERIVDIETYSAAQQASPETTELIQGLFSINYGTIILAFLFFFLVGYFLYAALFAAVGALIDNDTDSNQFTLPVTVPLILAVIMLPVISNNPDGTVAFWMSIIPFTAPVAMLIRIPFGVPIWEVILSSGLLIFATWGCIRLAAKIYRTGILMYGKKVTYKELWKWLKYKN